MTKWPSPVVRLFLGDFTPDAVLAAADDPNVATKNSHRCDANFYIGELKLLAGAKDDPAKLFAQAAQACGHDDVELSAANAELKVLKGQ
jgi:lipoprotein NlpI